MNRFTLKVTEAGKMLGETEVALPILKFVPEVAATLTTRDGLTQDLLGWGGALWTPMREPGNAPASERPRLTLERLAFLANQAPGHPDDFDDFADAEVDAPAFENPFNPNRFFHPLPGKSRSLLKVRTVEIERVTAGLAIIDGHVHRTVDEPVYVQLNDGSGLRLDVRFRDPSSKVSDSTWGVFRADRTDDANEFAAKVAAGMGCPYTGMATEIRMVYPQILKVDDVQLAFDEAFGRIEMFAKSTPGAEALADAARHARCLTADGMGFEDADQAEEAFGLLKDMRASLDAMGGKDDMLRKATQSVCAYVADRYETLDRSWLASRDAAPTFAP